MIIVKFWMHLSPGEQLKRFEARERDPLKAWKLTAEDWRNREKWPQYKAAVEEMLDRTDHARAPWVLVEGEGGRVGRGSHRGRHGRPRPAGAGGAPGRGGPDRVGRAIRAGVRRDRPRCASAIAGWLRPGPAAAVDRQVHLVA